MFEMLSGQFPYFRLPRATALPSCRHAEDVIPARRHCRHLFANGHLSTGQYPCQLEGLYDRSDFPGPAITSARVEGPFRL